MSRSNKTKLAGHTTGKCWRRHLVVEAYDPSDGRRIGDLRFGERRSGSGTSLDKIRSSSPSRLFPTTGLVGSAEAEADIDSLHQQLTLVTRCSSSALIADSNSNPPFRFASASRNLCSYPLLGLRRRSGALSTCLSKRKFTHQCGDISVSTIRA